jgi:microsomal epoxide hydrolase
LITALLGANYSDALEVINTNMLFVAPSTLNDPMALLDEQRKLGYRETKTFRREETGYQKIQSTKQKIQSTKPQTLAYGLTDSPAGLAGWIAEKFWTWSDGDAGPGFSRDRLLDNISIYWPTKIINSLMRLYYETDAQAAIPERVSVPTGHARYPAEISKTPRVWPEEVYDLERDARGRSLRRDGGSGPVRRRRSVLF